METYIELYHAEIDYITLTTWEWEIMQFWNKFCLSHNPKNSTEKAVQNYTGWMHYFPSGSVFVGGGEQKRQPHYIIKLSGNVAEEFKTEAFRQRLAYQVECRRIDLQVTIEEPRDWSQIALLNRIHKSNRVPGWAASVDARAGKLETVYIGSWHSDRLSTVYVKLTKGNSRLLRLETRYKKDRANAVLPQLAKGELPDNFLAHELQKVINDKKLRVIFEPHLTNNGLNPARVKLKQKGDKTSEWLLDKVLPTFARIVSEHDSDGEVLSAFLDVIDKVLNHE